MNVMIDNPIAPSGKHAVHVTELTFPPRLFNKWWHIDVETFPHIDSGKVVIYLITFRLFGLHFYEGKRLLLEQQTLQQALGGYLPENGVRIKIVKKEDAHLITFDIP